MYLNGGSRPQQPATARVGLSTPPQFPRTNTACGDSRGKAELLSEVEAKSQRGRSSAGKLGLK